jgi:tryptophan synthase beta subunit
MPAPNTALLITDAGMLAREAQMSRMPVFAMQLMPAKASACCLAAATLRSTLAHAIADANKAGSTYYVIGARLDAGHAHLFMPLVLARYTCDLMPP